jgi:hypothetical protein
MARKPISADTICVDEVDIFERDRLSVLLSNIFHLVYADLCVEHIYAERKRHQVKDTMIV